MSLDWRGVHDPVQPYERPRGPGPSRVDKWVDVAFWVTYILGMGFATYWIFLR